jgi:hypothetical protein
MLAAMDRELAASAEKMLKGDRSVYPNYADERFYMGKLLELNDRRIAPTLSARSQAAKSVRQRREYAFAAHWLGDSRPLVAFAEDCRLGNLELPPNDVRDRAYGRPPGSAEQEEIVGTLAAAGLAQTDRALNSFAEPNHPWYARTVSNILDADVADGSSPWLSHPFFLPVLRRKLDDFTETGVAYRISGGYLWRDAPGASSGEKTPDEFKGPNIKEAADERWCDRASDILTAVVVGLPQHHCLRKDADANIAALRKRVDQFQGRLRNALPIEVKIFDPDWERSFLLIPDFPALGRPASAEDAKAGRAVFHLNGKGKRVDKKLPLIGELKATGKDKQGERVLIVQAETNGDGEVVYGVIARHAIRAVPASALARVGTMDVKEWDEKK